MKTLVHTDKELIEATIKKCDICYVGLADTDGTPYVLPMNFGFSVWKRGIHWSRDYIRTN